MQPTPPAGDGTPNPFSPVFWVDTYVILNALGAHHQTSLFSLTPSARCSVNQPAALTAAGFGGCAAPTRSSGRQPFGADPFPGDMAGSLQNPSPPSTQVV